MYDLSQHILQTNDDTLFIDDIIKRFDDKLMIEKKFRSLHGYGVFLGIDAITKKKYSIKIRASSNQKNSVNKEHKVLKMLQDIKEIPKIKHYDSYDDGIFVLVKDFLPFQNIGYYCFNVKGRKTSKRMKWEPYFESGINLLSKIHEKGVVLRDFYEENVLVYKKKAYFYDFDKAEIRGHAIAKHNYVFEKMCKEDIDSFSKLKYPIKFSL